GRRSSAGPDSAGSWIGPAPAGPPSRPDYPPRAAPARRHVAPVSPAGRVVRRGADRSKAPRVRAVTGPAGRVPRRRPDSVKSDSYNHRTSDRKPFPTRESMKARQAVVVEPFKVEVRDAELPDPAPNQILVECEASAISAGTE